jgi:hypothetical protein
MLMADGPHGREEHVDRRQCLKLAAVAGLSGVMGRTAAGRSHNESVDTGSKDNRMNDTGRRWGVLVAGGGVAGVAAAIAAARAGARTVLVEKTFVPGGLATAGLINWYSPLCDGAGRQVTFGLAEELLHAGLKYGPGEVYGGWGNGDGPRTGRYHAHFQPACMVIAMEELLLEAGVEIMYDTLICQPVMEGNRVRGVEVENRDGRSELKAACIVDATGNATVAHRAGAPCSDGPGHGMVVQIFEASLEACREAVERGRGTGIRRVKLESRETKRLLPHHTCLDLTATHATATILDSRHFMRLHYAEKQARLGEDGRQNAYPVLISSIPQVRKSRRINGLDVLRGEDHKREIDSSVGLTANWIGSGQREVWQVPYGVLLPQKIRGVLAPGRNASSGDDPGWEQLRIIHCCVLTGEVAGVAAAMAAVKDTTPDALDVPELQEALVARGFKLRYEPGN